jgi:branched-chain amino acid transport system substrate-binding protein
MRHRTLKGNRRVIGALAVAVALAFVTACGSSPGGGSAASSNSIPVGVIGSFSGPAASSIAGAKLAIQAWADSVNASGGINGRHVQLYVEDDGGNVATSVSEAKQLVEQDHVVAIVGQATGDPDAWASYVQRSGIPVVGGNTASGIYFTNDDFFSVGGNLYGNFYGVAKIAGQNGPELGNLYCAELPSCADTVSLLSTFGESTGTSVSYSSKVSASAADFTAPCQGLKNSGVQSYTLGLAAATLEQVAAACTQQGLKAKLILSNVADSTFPSDPALNGAEIVDAMFPFFDTSNAATRQFHAVIKKYAPSLGTTSSPLNSEVTQAYASGVMFEAAVKASGSAQVTPESIKKGLYTFRNETFGGLTVPLTFTPGKPAVSNCFFTYQIENGAFTEPNGLHPICAPNGDVAAVTGKITG